MQTIGDCFGHMLIKTLGGVNNHIQVLGHSYSLNLLSQQFNRRNRLFKQFTVNLLPLNFIDNNYIKMILLA